MTVPLGETFLLCCEPGTKQLFLVSLGNQEAEKIQLPLNCEIDSKIRREEYKMSQLLDREKYEKQWFWDNENAQTYRRQMVPFYLLQEESSRFPTYVDNSEFNDGGACGYQISVKIKISSSITEAYNRDQQKRIDNYQKSKTNPSNSYHNQTIAPSQSTALPDYVELPHFSILAPAKSLIDTVEKKILHQTNINLNLQDRILVLKFMDVDSYVYGDTQLIYFVEIREHLRNKTNIELALISLSRDQVSTSMFNEYSKHEIHMSKKIFDFPPICQRQQGLPIQITKIEEDLKKTSSSIKRISFQSPYALQGRQSVNMGSNMLQRRQKTDKEPRKSVKARGDLSFMEKCIQRYRYVSLFQWYTPKKFQRHCGEIEYSERVPYNFMHKAMSRELVDRGYAFFLKTRSRHSSDVIEARTCKEGTGLLADMDLSCDQNIIPSCESFVPLRVDLLCLKDIVQILEQDFSQLGNNESKPFLIPKIVYRAPEISVNPCVADFLSQVQQLGSFGAEMPSHLRPHRKLANIGTNSPSSFSRFTFQVRNIAEHKALKKIDFTIEPDYVQIQSALYLGSRRISCFTYSQPSHFKSQITFQDECLQFYRVKGASAKLPQVREMVQDILLDEERGDMFNLDCLPSCTRICINVIVVPKRGTCAAIKDKGQVTGVVEGFVLGSCQMSLFDENFLARQGKYELRLWPFESFMPRMVCQGVCFQRLDPKATYCKNTINDQMSLLVQFQSYAGRVGWRITNSTKRKLLRKTRGQEKPVYKNEIDKMLTLGTKRGSNLVQEKESQYSLKHQTESLRQVKQLLDAYPMDLDEEKARMIDIETVLSFKNYIDKLPILIKLIDFTNSEHVRICYETLEKSGQAEQMTPEEALALLDGQFGDINVRIFAVKKLSLLEDSQIALVMPQLVQALKYELFHFSPLAEFLLEKALENTRVVGHAFFWALKANLHQQHCRERFYLILERFLMCCGQFKDDLFKQCLVDQSLIRLSNFVNKSIDELKKPVDQVLQEMHLQLEKEEFKIKMTQQLIIAHAKYDDHQIDCAVSHILTDESNGEEPIKLDHFQQKRASQKSKGSSGGTIYSFDISLIESKIEEYADAFFPVTEELYSDVREQNINTERKNLLEDSNKKFAELGTADKQLFYNRDSLIYYNGFPVEWKVELMNIPFAPKYPLSSFARTGCKIFLSKKKPLLIIANLASHEETERSLKEHESRMLLVEKHPLSKQEYLDGTIMTSHRRMNNTIVLSQTPRITEMVKKGSENKMSSLTQYQKLQTPRLIHNEQSQTKIEIQDIEDPEQQQEKQEYSNHEPEDQEPRKVKRFMFKSGDDLRQDNLVLQFFKIMDKLWNDLDMNMVCYDAMESGFETGYIEFIDNATVITDMHKRQGFLTGPFQKASVMNYFLRKVAKEEHICMAENEAALQQRLSKYHMTFLSSLAGQCVATYVLGVKDRHPGNYMLEDSTGRFFHIDFGHFLNHAKLKIGFKRDREPFIFSKELEYFLTHFHRIDYRLVNQRAKLTSNSELRGDTPSGYLAEESQTRNPKDLDSALSMRHESVSKLKYIENTASIVRTRGPSMRLMKFELYLGNSNDTPPAKWMELFENKACNAFLKLRKNADIFINLLVLMIVSGLEELDLQSIGFLKKAMFLDVSEEEATVKFRDVIEIARKQWYRPIDNLFHVISDYNKKRKRAKLERRAVKKPLTK